MKKIYPIALTILILVFLFPNITHAVYYASDRVILTENNKIIIDDNTFG